MSEFVCLENKLGAKMHDAIERDPRPFHVLGIHHSGPIASAAIVRDGILVAASPEERFTRVKQDRSFPHKAIQHCLDACKIRLEDVDRVAIGWNAGGNAAPKYRNGVSDW